MKSDNGIKSQAPPDLADRVLAACVATGAMLLTILTLTLLALALVPKGGTRRTLYQYFFEHVSGYLWSTATVLALTVIAGFMLGTVRIASLFGHLWFTEKPHRTGLTAALWGMIFAAVLTILLLAGAGHTNE